MKWIVSALIVLLAGTAYSLDTEYSNEQAGVKMKILGFGQDVPLLRIENRGRQALAIRTDLYLAISFRDGDKETPRRQPSSAPTVTSISRPIQRDVVTIVNPGTNIELPLYKFWFRTIDGLFYWDEGIAAVAQGKHEVRLTTNCIGITALDVNFTPFRHNFDIPPFEFEVK